METILSKTPVHMKLLAVSYEYYPFLDVIIGSRRSQHKRPNSREDLEPCVVIGIPFRVSPEVHINSMSLTETHVIKQQIQVKAQHAVEIIPEGKEVETLLRRHFESEYSRGILGA